MAAESKAAQAAAEEQAAAESKAAQAAAAEEQEMSEEKEKEMPDTLALAKAEHGKRLYHKSKFRSLQRQRMRSARKKDELLRKARVGSKVNVAIDERDIHGAQGLIGIVFGVSQAGGCRIVTRHGILGYDKKQGADSKRKLYIPIDQYKLLEDDAPVHEELETIRNSVLGGKFEEKDFEILTKKRAHQQEYSPQTGKICGCKSQKCRNCVCSRAGRECTESCACSGICQNPHNPPESESEDD